MSNLPIYADAATGHSKGASSFKNQIAAPKNSDFSWSHETPKGVFMNINKSILNIDLEYQRGEVSPHKVNEIASNWDWALVGVLLVSLREDNSFWVIDGGHRYRAALKRADVVELPCMVFDQMDQSKEARVFVGANTMKSVVKALDLHKAALQAKEPLAILVNEILKKHNYRAAKSSQKSDPHLFAAVNTLRRLIKINRYLAERAFAACVLIADGKTFSGKLLHGLFYCANKLKDKADILQGSYLERLVKIGAEGIEQSIRRECHIQGGGGEAVWAKAILDCINKGCRRRLMFSVEQDMS